MVGELVDPRRSEPPFIGGEREMLENWLDWHRTTLLLKCEGLEEEVLKRRAVPTSLLSLHGLIRHMAEVEQGWFQRVFLRQPDLGYIWADDDVEDKEIAPLDDAEWVADLTAWETACEESRAAAAGRDLDDTGLKNGQEVSLRWIYVHMIEEYARHNGHADLLRELLDGRVGW
jgi:uncharacterized damage-inducible protein DinB